MDAVTSGLNTEIFSAEREWTVEGLPVLTAQVSLPEPVGSENRTTRRIRRYYRAQCRAFLRYCDRWLFPMAARACREALADSRPLPQLQAELSFRVTYNEGGFWSLYTQIREPAADGHILLRRWGDTWDLRRGYPVSLPSFFPHRRGWKRRLLTLAAQEIQRQETAGYARYLDGWLRRLRQQFNPMRFYLTPEGLAFFYPMYAIAPAAEGIPVFTVPYEAVGPYVPVSKAEPSSSAPQSLQTASPLPQGRCLLSYCSLIRRSCPSPGPPVRRQLPSRLRRPRSG